MFCTGEKKTERLSLDVVFSASSVAAITAVDINDKGVRHLAVDTKTDIY